MRIAYVCADSGVPVFGGKGCSVHVREILRALVRRGHDLTLLASRFDGPPPPELGGIKTVELPRTKSRETGERERFAFDRNEELSGLLSEQGPFDLIYERFSLWSHSALEHARECATPSVVEVNAPLIDEQAAHRQLVHRDLAEESARRAFTAAGAIVAVSDEVAGWARQLAPSDANMHVIHNGVCPERFRPQARPQIATTPKTFTVGFVGALRPWHGVNHLLDAYLQLHQARASTRLLIVGDGPQGEQLRRRVAELPSRVGETIHFTGAVAPEEIPGWLTSMQAAVAPYADSESFYFSPLKVFEYMAAGRAVVASRVGQLGEVLQQGRCGLLTEAGDARSLADALITLCDHPILVEELGAAARLAVLRLHSWDEVAAQILAICELQQTQLTFAAEGAPHAATR